MKIKYSLKKLSSLPTLHQGHFDNLKIEDKETRVWLSRMTIEDGMPYNNQVTIEKYWFPKGSKGRDQSKGKVWETIAEYEAK